MPRAANQAMLGPDDVLELARRCLQLPGILFRILLQGLVCSHPLSPHYVGVRDGRERRGRRPIRIFPEQGVADVDALSCGREDDDVSGRGSRHQALKAAPFSHLHPSPHAYLVRVQRHEDIGDAVDICLDKGLDAPRVLVGAWHWQGATLVEIDLERRGGGCFSRGGEGVGGGLSRPAPYLWVNDEQREGTSAEAVLHAGLLIV